MQTLIVGKSSRLPPRRASSVATPARLHANGRKAGAETEQG